ncbi:MAG TPA: type II toxin-antitoxin system RelE/ParE family toxin [Nitrospirae bacterium]|nr:type II toxin-antitoxin system RelE/ParE family toxin [Nitrospirota bacterium]
MAWRIEFYPDAFREFSKLDRETQRRILKFLKERIAPSDNPQSFGKALGSDKKGLWRYRVGDYRIICSLKEETFLVLIVKVGHRRIVYD